VPLLDRYHAAVNKSRHFAARLPLPFGLVAHLDTRTHSQAPDSTFIADRNAIFFNRPTFEHGLLGGLQLATTGPPNNDPHARDKPLPGRVDLVDDNQYAQALARLDGLIALGIRDKVALQSMSPADFQSVARVIEGVAPDEIYNLSGQSSVSLSFTQPAETLSGIALGTRNMLEALRRLSRACDFTMPVLPSALAIPKNARRTNRPHSARRALMASPRRRPSR
jgi:GDP-mannose 4,6 dehydratase